MLARASLLLQKTLGIAADPLLVADDHDALVDAVESAALIVAGLSNREGRRELGLGSGLRCSRTRPRQCFSFGRGSDPAASPLDKP